MTADTQDVARRGDEEGAPAKKIPYPKSVIFICANEFCERFSYYGMRAILSIYLRNIIGYSENTATMVYHLFIVFCYLTPTMGAMLADSVLGKFRTIFYLSIVYAAGQVLLALTSIPSLNFPEEAISLIGLALIALGTGGIKPCVSSFGADQFKMPEQASYVAAYFSIFYFCINAGSLISTFITPIFREDIKCFGKESCYPLAFGVPAALMVVSLVIFILGRPLYKINKPSGNIFAQIVRNIFHALSRKKQLKHEKRPHFMDYADDTLTRKEIEGIKVLLQILWLYLPLPLYWALYDQQGSRWTFQATRMDGSMGGSFTIKPDQMQLINAFLILLFIPLFEKVIYPVLGACNLVKKPLQRLTVGGVMIGVAFIVSGLVELKLQSTYPVDINGGQSHIQIINTLDYNLTGKYQMASLEAVEFSIEGHSSFLPDKALDRGEGPDEGKLKITFEEFEWSIEHILTEEKASTFVIHRDPTDTDGTNIKWFTPQDHPSVNPDDQEHSAFTQVEKSEDTLPYLRILQVGVWTNCAGDKHCLAPPAEPCKDDDNIRIALTKVGCEEEEGAAEEDFECTTYFNYTSNCTFYSDYYSTPATELDAGTYNLTIDGILLNQEEIELKTGGSYTYTIVKHADGSYSVQMDTVTEPNSVHMLWLLPQYVILTAAEVMFSVTIMDFSYAEAPTSMKSVLQACWLLTVAGGNIIIAIVAELSIFDKQWKEFFLFAGLMFASMGIFAYMAYLYKPANLAAFEDDENDKKGKENEGFKEDKDD